MLAMTHMLHVLLVMHMLHAGRFVLHIMPGVIHYIFLPFKI